MVGKPKAPMPIEDEIIGGTNLLVTYTVVKNFELTGVKVDPLDVTPDIVVRNPCADPRSVVALCKADSARVGDVAVSVGSNGSAVRPSA